MQMKANSIVQLPETNKTRAKQISTDGNQINGSLQQDRYGGDWTQTKQDKGPFKLGTCFSIKTQRFFNWSDLCRPRACTLRQLHRTGSFWANKQRGLSTSSGGGRGGCRAVWDCWLELLAGSVGWDCCTGTVVLGLMTGTVVLALLTGTVDCDCCVGTVDSGAVVLRLLTGTVVLGPLGQAQ